MPLTVPLLAAATGVLGSAFASGGIGGYSIYTMPALLESAPTAASLCKLWYASFSRGYYLPTICALSGTAYLYAASQRYGRGAEFRGFLAGGLLTAGIIPYTMVAILPVINVLHAAAATGAATTSMEEARRLVLLWTTRSVVRSVMTMAGAVLGLWNLLDMMGI